MAVWALGLASGVTTAQGHRLGSLGLSTPVGALDSRAGIYPSTGAAAYTVNTSMSLSIAPFSGWVEGTSTASQGGYAFCMDAATIITFDAGNASTIRTDQIIARVKDNAFDGSGATTATVEYLKGNTTTGAKTALPAGSFALYEVAVPVGASSGGGGITFASVTTRVFPYTTSCGGVVPVVSTTDRTTLGTPMDGHTIYRTDTKWLESATGGVYVPSSIPIVSTVANLSTITNPLTGSYAVVSATGLLYRWNGSAWLPHNHHLKAYKTADQTISSNNTLQNDTHLVLAVEANAVYRLELTISYNASATAGFKIDFTAPAGTTFECSRYLAKVGGVVNYDVTNALGSVTGFTGAAASQPLRIEAMVFTSGTAGNLQFRWAQTTSHASNCTVYKGSALDLFRFA